MTDHNNIQTIPHCDVCADTGKVCEVCEKTADECNCEFGTLLVVCPECGEDTE